MKTKNLILMLMGMFMINTTKAVALTTDNVLLEKKVLVYFASPEHQGIYRFQVLASGIVQNVDNKNNKTKLATLSPIIIKEVQTAINSLPNDLQVVEQGGPRCLDAPSSNTTVTKTNGKNIVIRTVEACILANARNSTAVKIADWAEELEKSLTVHFEQPPAMIGQEGYGSPAFRELKKILRCEDEVVMPDNGFALYLEEIPGKTNQYNLVVERSLFTGPVTENYVVKNKTDPHLLGSPARYENNTVKLSVQGTVTPRPDHKLVGSFVKLDASGRTTEVRNLLCNYINE